MASNSTNMYAFIKVDTGDTTAYFDGAMLVEGSSAFSFSPKPVVEGFGSWVDNTSSYGATLAATDGFVVAKATNTELQGYTDSASNPTTLRVHTDAGGDVCMTFPVRKGDYWKVVVVGGTTNIGVFWLPLGR